MISFLSALGAAYLALAGLLFAIQRSLLYFPDISIPLPGPSGVPEMKPVFLTTADGLRLLAWSSPAMDSLPTVVFFHGNAGNIGGRGEKARPFLDAGYGLLMVEYRGYGGNLGTPTEEGLYNDGRAALDFLAAAGTSPDNIVLYGESLGSGVAVKMASEMAAKGKPAFALILEAPFTSIIDAAAHHFWYFPARLLVRDRFDSASLIESVNCPLFIVHGEDDETVPVELGRRLFDLAREPKENLWIRGASHNGIYAFNAEVRILDFLKQRFEARHEKSTPKH